MKVIGLTGGIASGKSTISRYLAELGAIIIDADKLAREVVEPGQPAWQEIVDYFGPEVLTTAGNLDRNRLGQIVFLRPEARQQLNQITHPRVIEKTRKLLHELTIKAPQGVAVVDAPLLIEAGMTDLVDQVWLIAVEEEIQISRLIARNGLQEAEARRRIASQMPLQEKVKWADCIIDNNGSIVDTLKQVQRLWKELITS